MAHWRQLSPRCGPSCRGQGARRQGDRLTPRGRMAELPQVALVLGGARSGKSAFAQELAQQSGEPVVFVATARADDPEMVARVAAHRAARPASWRTLEAPRAPGD